jgi:hypothetical protein
MSSLGLGADIREVYTELGTAVSVITRTPIITGETVLYDINAQATKPFIREHHLDSTFPYDTEITVNDVVQFTKTGDHYLIMNKTPEMFEDSVVEYSVVLYKCNLSTSVHVLRPIEIRDAATYNMVVGWHVAIDSPIYGLMSDRIFGSSLEEGSRMAGQFQIWRIDLYIPKFYGIKPLDRIVISEHEYYKVESIDDYSYPGVSVALLVEDTRLVSIIIDDDVYGDDEYG